MANPQSPRRQPDETLTLAAVTPPMPGEPVEVRVRAPERIGAYRIVETLGEGGFGVVYLAEQTEPVRRRVALKVLKPGIDSQSVIARFEAERQALAMMDHPNVARVFDAGTAPDGRPFFVMEHVPGVPLTDHCARHRLAIGERLELMILVCEAVQHAHQKGIIHRDIKPSNILVEFIDGRAIPKVIDFGVAKAIGQAGPSKQAVHTELGQLVGTPEYMSPEQAERTAQDIDTRADIYSLGVLLYELLTGTLPFDSKELRQATYIEIQRIIREVDPPRPSTRLTTLITKGGESSAERRWQPPLEPRTLQRLLKGDLDWIVMKAMEKDRTRRYDTAAALANDLRRHLRNEPVSAGPPSAAYKLSKFIRRNRGVVVSASIVTLALVGGVVASSVLAVGQARARGAAERAGIRAVAEAGKATAVTDFLKEMLSSVDPHRAASQDITMREVLDEASRKMDGSFRDQPDVEVELRRTIGNTYLALGQYDAAEKHLMLAQGLSRPGEGGPSASYADTLDHLSALRVNQGRYEEGERFAREAVEIRRGLTGGRDLPAAISLHNVAWALDSSGKYAEAEPLYREALAIIRASGASGTAAEVKSLNGLALALKQQRKLEEAEPLYREAIELRRRLDGPESLGLALLEMNYGQLLDQQGRYDEAVVSFRSALAVFRKRLDPAHPDVATVLNNLAFTLQNQGKFDEAEAMFREALSALTARLGPDHTSVCMARHNLSRTLSEQGRFSEAAEAALAAVRSAEKSLPAGHWFTAVFRGTYGRALTGLGQYSEAETQLLAAHRVLEADRGPTHERTVLVIRLIADNYEQWGRADDARAWRARAEPAPADSR